MGLLCVCLSVGMERDGPFADELRAYGFHAEVSSHCCGERKNQIKGLVQHVCCMDLFRVFLLVLLLPAPIV